MSLPTTHHPKPSGIATALTGKVVSSRTVPPVKSSMISRLDGFAGSPLHRPVAWLRVKISQLCAVRGNSAGQCVKYATVAAGMYVVSLTGVCNKLE